MVCREYTMHKMEVSFVMIGWILCMRRGRQLYFMQTYRQHGGRTSNAFTVTSVFSMPSR